VEDPEEMMIGEEPLISPDYYRYKTVMYDNRGNVLGYALECEDSDLDICIFKGAYKEPFKPYIDKKIDKILSTVKCSTTRIILINENCGTEHIIMNFTDSTRR
jgi:hypothetical protein